MTLSITRLDMQVDGQGVRAFHVPYVEAPTVLHG